MTERWLITPPEIVEADDRLIFLAGPIQGAPDWQTDAARMIHDADPSITVASPRKNYDEGTFVYEKQVDWETHFLRKAGKVGVIAFWLAAQVEETPGRSYAQTTRFELAEWKVKHERGEAYITLGIEPGFGNERYIRRRFGQDVPNVKITDNLEEMTQNAVDLTPNYGNGYFVRKISSSHSLVYAKNGTIENVVPNQPLNLD